MAVPIPQLRSTLGPAAGYSALLAPTAFLALFLASDIFFIFFRFTAIPSLSLPFLLSFCFSLLHYLPSSLSFFFFLLFFCVLLFHLGSFFFPYCTTETLLLLSLRTSAYYRQATCPL